MTSPSFLYLEFPLCSRHHAWMYWIAQIQLGGGKTKARHFSAEMTQKLIARDGQKAGGCLLAQACITLQITLLCVFKIYFTTMRIRGICCNENWHCVITVQIFSQIIWLAWVLACYSISSGKFLGQLDQLGITKVHPMIIVIAHLHIVLVFCVHILYGHAASGNLRFFPTYFYNLSPALPQCSSSLLDPYYRFI